MEKENKNSIKGIVKALSDFQAACPAIKKDSEAGTKFKYKYGSLPMILEVIKPHMKKAGLTFSQPIVTTAAGGEMITTILYHVGSGETIESQMFIRDIVFERMNTLQSKGSEITYLRRYGLMSILGIVAEEDDNDGQGEQKPKSQAKPATGSAAHKQDQPKAAALPWLNPMVGGEKNGLWNQALKYLADGGKIGTIKSKYRLSKVNEDKLLSESLTFDDLPFDRMEAEGVGSEELQGGPGEVKPNEPNMLFESQGGDNE